MMDRWCKSGSLRKSSKVKEGRSSVDVDFCRARPKCVQAGVYNHQQCERISH